MLLDPLDLGVHEDNQDLQGSVLQGTQDIRGHRVGLEVQEVWVNQAVVAQQVIIPVERGRA